MKAKKDSNRRSRGMERRTDWLTGHQSVQYLNSRLSFARKESSTSGQWRILSIDRLQILFNEVHPVCPVQFTIQIRMILQRSGVKRRSMQNNWITNLFTPAKYRKVVWRWDKSDLGNLRRDRGRWWRFRSIRRSISWASLGICVKRSSVSDGLLEGIPEHHELGISFNRSFIVVN